MTAVAWDIETCPVPVDALTRAQRARYNKALAHKLSRKPDMDREAASRLVRSVHPFLGWICCISAVSGTLKKNLICAGTAGGSNASGTVPDSGLNEPVSWTASSPGEEAGLLEAFWSAVADFPQGTTWITFNGKRFDVPYVETRSMAHGITPSRADLRNTYPYSTRPHADLACLWPQHYSLDGLCDLLAIPSPKIGLAWDHPTGVGSPNMDPPTDSHPPSYTRGGDSLDDDAFDPAKAEAGDVSVDVAPPVNGGDGVVDNDIMSGTDRIDRIGNMDRIDGSDVARLVESGQLRALKAYAERDAVATWTCAQRLLPRLCSA